MVAKILIADDHPVVLEGTKHALASLCACIRLATQPSEVRACLLLETFDLVILDLSFRESETSGFDLLRDITAAESPPVLVLSMYDEPGVQEAARLGGARGFVSKSATSAQLCGVVEIVLAGGESFGASRGPGGRASPRQRQIAVLLSQGASEKQIAGVLGITLRTVEFHVGMAKRSMGARTTCQLIQLYHDRGMFLPGTVGSEAGSENAPFPATQDPLVHGLRRLRDLAQ